MHIVIYENIYMYYFGWQLTVQEQGETDETDDWNRLSGLFHAAGKELFLCG